MVAWRILGGLFAIQFVFLLNFWRVENSDPLHLNHGGFLIKWAELFFYNY